MTSAIFPIIIFLPALGALLLALLRNKAAALRRALLLLILLAEAVMAVVLALRPPAAVTLLVITDMLKITFAVDTVSKIFLLVAVFGFLFAGIYAIPYIKHSEQENGFFSFFLLSLSALMGMDLSANLTTMYLFFEMVTLLSMPMVLHDRTKESIHAALKYLFYSMAGAFLALGCIFLLSHYCNGLDFVPGGTLDAAKAAQSRTLLEIAVFLGVVGFGAKAGMYPLHGWLPTAHPVAPAPASAVLSGIVAKAGVLAIIRMLFYSVGTDFLRGSWVQSVWLALALLTVFMGSMMAYRETVLKKRLAYSSVSQISYVLVGLFLMTPEGVAGGLLHVIFHAVIKICLFMIAGALITVLGKHRTDDLKGVGRAMPVTMISFTLAALALVGIPPASGFVSKWYLALGALSSRLAVYTWLAPVVLLVSALLTAGYLLPITIDAFFPKKQERLPERTKEGGPMMWLPIAALALLTLLLGIFSGPLVELTLGLGSALV